MTRTIKSAVESVGLKGAKTIGDKKVSSLLQFSWSSPHNSHRKGNEMKKEALSDAVKSHIDSIEALHLELNTQLNVNENLRAQLAEAMNELRIKDGEVTLLTRTVDVERLSRRHFERLSDQLMTQLSTVRTLIDEVFKKVGEGMRKKDMEAERINGQDEPAPTFLLKGPADDHTS